MYKIYFEQFVPPPGRTKQFLRVMKLTILLMFSILMQVSATSFGQKVTLTAQNVNLTTVLTQIKQQTGYDFAITGNAAERANPVTINVKNKELTEVLQQIFEGQPLDYRIEDNSVEVFLKAPTFLENLKDRTTKLFGLSAHIHGKVIDSTGQSLPGAVVSLNSKEAASSYFSTTNSKGEFDFPDIPQENYTLSVTYVGYSKLERYIHIDSRDMSFIFLLHSSSSSLDEIQVIAYGSESKRFSVGSYTTVSAEAIEKQPVTNPLLALEGQAPGLNVTAMNGVPGSTTLVQIRGQNTLATNSLSQKPYDQPLFIIDGVPSATQNVNISQLGNLAVASSGFSGGISQATGLSPFNDINPNDIESITILKDADATSIYGSQGANGVVLITTKKGKPGKTTFDINLNSQFNEVAKPIQLLNTQQYLQVRKDAFAADGATPSSDPTDPNYAPDLTIYDQSKYTNWQKIIQGNSTNNTDLHASLSGGSVNNTFFVSTGYTRSDYNYPGSFADQRYTLHSAFTNTSADKRFTLVLITDYAYDQNNSAGFGGSPDVVLPPNSPDMVDGNGNLIWNYKGVDLNTDNFYASLLRPSDLSSFNFNSGLNLSYQIIQGLKISVNMGYSRNTGTEHSIDPLSSQDPSQYGNTSNAAFATTSAQTINVEPQINYEKNIGQGTLTALIGGTYKKNTTDDSQTGAYGYSNDNFLNSINGAANVYPYDNANIFKYVAIRSRLKYVYDQKYILEVTGTRDGSSNFGPGRQFGDFGSAAAGWIFSGENVFKKALPFFSYGKLTASYGTTGSDASKAYQYQALYQTFATYDASNFQGIRQAYPYNLFNPDFSWATKKSLNLSLDFGLFNNRLLLNATYYRDREGDQLVDYPLSAQAGFPTVFENEDATIQNKGWEFSATSTNIKTKDFTWTSNFNISLNRNKLLAFPNLATSSYAQQYVIGQPTSVIFGYRYKDVNPTTGQFEYYAANGKVTSNPNYGTAATGGDMVIIGNRETNYTGGFGNTFTYKKFSFYVFCQFSSGDEPNALSALYNGALPGGEVNLPTYVLGKYWTTPGQNATLQRLSSSYNSAYSQPAYDFTQSSGALSNDTYLRVKTAALSYALPEAWLKKVHISNGSIYVNAQNLITITNYKFGDPEQPGDYSSFPLQRIVALGLNLKF